MSFSIAVSKSEEQNLLMSQYIQECNNRKQDFKNLLISCVL